MRAILTYHSIDDSGSAISVDAATFRTHAAWLSEGGVPVVGLESVLETTGPAVAVTFDDGFRSFAQEAWPLLRDRAIPVTLFVVSDRVGGRNDWGRPGRVPELPLLDWHELGRLVEEGVTLGAHTRTHPDLTRAHDSIGDELDGCVERIERETGVRPSSFAYPFGRLDAAVVTAVRSRFEAACTTELRPLGYDEDAHRLPRLDAWYLRNGTRLEEWGTPRMERYLRRRRRLRRARSLVLEGVWS
jgi:peptidoglycan/xylan/chitin deacetylase (PgdA/CDA1 family)